MLAGCCSLAAAGLALNHPLSPPWAIAACTALLGLSFWKPHDHLLWVLPLLPVAGLATWSGWVTFEEFDLLVLATAGGAALRHAADSRTSRLTWGGVDRRWLSTFCLTAFAVLVAVAAVRGVMDAGGWQWSWWHGYHEAMNPLRLAKGYYLSLLLLVLWLKSRQVNPHLASVRWIQGMAGVLATTAAMTLWERTAFTGLLNFSSDYRATALFWEMHAGGAALDVVLVMCFASLASALTLAKDWRSWLGWISVALLAAYACAVTFSRVVYVGAPLVLLVWWLGRILAARSAPAVHRPKWSVFPPLLALAFGLAAATLFPVAGYRGLLALVGCLAILLPLIPRLQQLPAGAAVSASLMGVLVSAMAYFAAAEFAKVTYLVYALAFLGAALLVLVRWSLSPAAAAEAAPAPASAVADMALLALYVCLCMGLGAVSVHWGGDRAATVSISISLALGLAPLLLRASRLSPWPASPRWQVSFLAFLASLGLIAGVLSGGAYMGSRWAQVEQDLNGRSQHWSNALSRLQSTTDWVWGRGSGRYASTSLLSADVKNRAGDYRWQADPAGGHVVLTGGNHVIGWGEMLRVSQRVSEPGGPVEVRFKARASSAVAMHFEICEKHLLYHLTCVFGKRQVPAKPGEWQDHSLQLRGAAYPTRGFWYAPRLMAFSMAVESSGGRVEVDDVQLLQPAGTALLSNGDFSNGLAHWYSTSDHLHLQWHAKNLLVHLLFEQGVLGLGMFLAMVVLALWRLGLGPLRKSPFAVPLFSAILGLLVVGVADSVLDMPRIAVLVYLSLGVAMMTKPPQVVSANSVRPSLAHT